MTKKIGLKKKIDLDKILNNILINNFLSFKNNKNNTYIIDLFETIKNINQINILINRLPNKEKANIGLLITNRFIRSILTQFLQKLDSNSNIKIISSNISEIKGLKYIVIFSDLKTSESQLNSILKKFSDMEKYIYLIVTKTEKLNIGKNGSYFLHTENNELKNLFFVITLLNKITKQ